MSTLRVLPCARALTRARSGIRATGSFFDREGGVACERSARSAAGVYDGISSRQIPVEHPSVSRDDDRTSAVVCFSFQYSTCPFPPLNINNLKEGGSMNLDALLQGVTDAGFREFLHFDKNPLGGGEKKRLIFAPNDAMRVVHARLIRSLRALGFSMPHATGSLPGSSVRRNIDCHVRNRYFYLIDLQSAYLNVSLDRLTEVLCEIDPVAGNRFSRDGLHQFLEHFCVRNSGLATGAPASPDLFNLYAAVLIDQAITSFCEVHNFRYTRYLDDLTFSSRHPIGKHKRRIIRMAVAKAGFRISHHKSVVADLRKGPIKLNGMLLQWQEPDQPARVLLPRAYLRRIRGLIHIALHADPETARSLAKRIHGMMSAFRQSQDKRRVNRIEEKLLAQYTKLRRRLRRRA